MRHQLHVCADYHCDYRFVDRLSIIDITNPFVRMLAHLLLLPLVVGISYEFNRYAGRSESLLSRALRWPGI